MKPFLPVCLLTVSLLLGPAVRAEDASTIARPVIEQVDVAVSRKEYGVALAALRRFPQADRDKKWSGLVEKAAIGQLATLFKEAPAGNTRSGIELKKEFPLLKKSKDFTHLQTQLAAEDLRLCLGNTADGYDCSEKLFQALQDSDEPDTFYVQMAKLVGAGVSVAAAMPFLKLAAEHGLPTKKACSTPEAQGLLILGLQLPPGPSRKLAQDLATGRCAPVMTPLLKNARATNNPHFKESLCEMKMCPKQ